MVFYAFATATAHGDVDTLKWLHGGTVGCPWDDNNTYEKAAEQHQLYDNKVTYQSGCMIQSAILRANVLF